MKTHQFHGFSETPYRGLVPYSEEDAPFFFGREKEQRIITDNLRASRLTLLYGTSGVGKSSVLKAGVAYNLHQAAEQNLKKYGTPEFTVLVFNSWTGNPLDKLIQQVKETIAKTIRCDLDTLIKRLNQQPKPKNTWLFRSDHATLRLEKLKTLSYQCLQALSPAKRTLKTYFFAKSLA